ncbi:MAG: hypothetical protein AAFX86_04770 [Pseudomonadota bacterium]
MRSVFLGATLLVLAGCATVSVVPGEATVETSLSAKQTALRTASDTFCERLESEGWVEASNGFANLASILMHGQSDTETATSYADAFSDLSVAPSVHLMTIADDANAAREGLEQVAGEARKVLNDQTVETQRSDVTSFERALVRAQRASRAFAGALETVGERTSQSAPADTAIEAFNAEIDDARRLADELAARYASLGENSV